MRAVRIILEIEIPDGCNINVGMKGKPLDDGNGETTDKNRLQIGYKRPYNKWSAEDIKWLKEHHEKHSTKEIAEITARSETSVQMAIYKYITKGQKYKKLRDKKQKYLVNNIRKNEKIKKNGNQDGWSPELQKEKHEIQVQDANGTKENQPAKKKRGRPRKYREQPVSVSTSEITSKSASESDIAFVCTRDCPNCEHGQKEELGEYYWCKPKKVRVCANGVKVGVVV